MIWVFTGRTPYCPKIVFQISMSPASSPYKLVSFPFHIYFCTLYWKWEGPRIVCRRPVAYLSRPMRIYVGITKWVLQFFGEVIFLTMSPCNIFPLTDTKHWALKIKKKKKKKNNVITRRGPGTGTFFVVCVRVCVCFSCTTRNSTGVGS